MCDITYEDRGCVCLEAESNAELLKKLPRALDIMQEVFTSHFLDLNWKPLKTECDLHMVGRGTKHAWETIERSAQHRAEAGTGAAKQHCAMLQTRRIYGRWCRRLGMRTSSAHASCKQGFFNHLRRYS